MFPDPGLRITYWTGLWDPSREALSKEVEAIRDRLSPRAPVVSFSAGQGMGLGPGRVVRLGRRGYPLLRALAAAIEPRGALTHAFGAVDCWHLLRSLGRRPMVLTVAIPGRPLPLECYRRVARFVAQTPALAESLVGGGVDPEKIVVLPPGLDLGRFRAIPAPADGPFRILFASAPASPADFEARGVPLLVELARRVPDVEVVLLWRAWGDEAATRAAIEALDPPPNARVLRQDVRDIREVLAGVHAVACVYAAGYGKSAPNSVLEGLAAGRPALLADTCDIAGEVLRSDAGAVGPRTVEGLAGALERLRSRWTDLSRGARRLAERAFDGRRALAVYGEIYRELAPEGVPARSAR